MIECRRPKLKITEIRTAEVRVHGNQVHVRVYTDQGIVGQGESTDAAQGNVPLIRSFARLLVGNPAENARAILEHETLFRIGIAGDIVYCLGVVVVLAALYVILRPVSQGLALFMAVGRLIHGLTWLLATLNIFTALRLLTDADYRALGADHLPTLAQL